MKKPFVAASIQKLAAIAFAVALLSAPAVAQRTAPGEIGKTRSNTPINAAKDVSWSQKLDNQLSLDTPFRNEDDKVVPLSTYFGKKPVVLVMPFYKCPGVCTNELNGMVDAFKNDQMKFKVGRDFEVVTISINPKEGGELATAKKREYLDILDQPGAEGGWHFLTGDEANIRKIADQTGFKYVYDAKTDQYAHPAGLVVLTPDGKVSKYFFNVAFPARDLKLALTEAGQGRVGTAIDNWLLACYHYDPKSGTYGPRIFAIMQVVGISTILILGSFMVIAFRKDARAPRLVRYENGEVGPEGYEPNAAANAETGEATETPRSSGAEK